MALPGNATIDLDELQDYRASHYHLRELPVLFLTALYVLLFVIGLTGNVLILVWIYKQQKEMWRRSNSLFNPFLINLCIADQLVLLTCCPLMIYTAITAFWHLGNFLCSLIHYLQAIAVTCSTLSMATIALQRFLLIRFPVNASGSDNLKLHKTITRWLLISVWLISITTAWPIFEVRKEKDFEISGQQFTFCLELWNSDHRKRFYSGLIFAVVYLCPSLVLLFCHLRVGFLIRVYERSTRNAAAIKLLDRNSFNRRAFREHSTTTLNTTTTMSSSVNDSGKQRHAKHLNQKRRRLSQLIIWTTIVFVLCWLPYNLVSLVIDNLGAEANQLFISVLPFTLLLGQFHSAVNPVVYWLLNRSSRI